MAFVLLCSSGTRPRILVPPNSIATVSEDLEAGQEEGQESEHIDDFKSDIPKYIRCDDLPKSSTGKAQPFSKCMYKVEFHRAQQGPKVLALISPGHLSGVLLAQSAVTS